jgi:hypothetical protein
MQGRRSFWSGKMPMPDMMQYQEKHRQPCLRAVEMVWDGMSSPIGVGIAIAASLKRLFEKLTNGVPSAFWIRIPAKPVQLTDEGRRLLERVRAAISEIAEGVEAIRLGNTDRILTISTVPCFAVYWLLPRLADFNEHNPDIQVHIRAALSLTDLTRDGADMGFLGFKLPTQRCLQHTAELPFRGGQRFALFRLNVARRLPALRLLHVCHAEARDETKRSG